MKLKGTFILLLIAVSLVPVYMLHKYLQRVMRHKESMALFLGGLFAMLVFIFVYTFLVVFIIQMLFPAA